MWAELKCIKETQRNKNEYPPAFRLVHPSVLETPGMLPSDSQKNGTFCQGCFGRMRQMHFKKLSSSRKPFSPIRNVVSGRATRQIRSIMTHYGDP